MQTRHPGSLYPSFVLRRPAVEDLAGIASEGLVGNTRLLAGDSLEGDHNYKADVSQRVATIAMDDFMVVLKS